MAKLKIQSAGLIDGEWKVLFDNGDELDRVYSIEATKNMGMLGELVIKVAADNWARMDKQKLVE